jgi:hypothetical protein
MSTLNLQVGSANDTSDQQSGQDNTGRTYTNTGACTLGRGTFMPGSHTSNDEWSGACRFTGVTIAQGATINSANFILNVQSGWDAAALGRVIKYYVSAEAADNAAALASTGANLTSTNRPRTTATTAWTQNTTTTASDQTASITAVVQEIVNRAGWSSGNAIVILVDTHEDTTTGEWQEYQDYTGSAAAAPKLQIDYTAGGGASPASRLMLLGVG